MVPATDIVVLGPVVLPAAVDIMVLDPAVVLAMDIVVLGPAVVRAMDIVVLVPAVVPATDIVVLGPALMPLVCESVELASTSSSSITFAGGAPGPADWLPSVFFPCGLFGGKRLES
jgi:hypothetical protein